MAAAKKAAAKKAASSSSKKGGGLRVIAPLVGVVTENGSTVHLYFGDVVPEGVQQESIDNLKDLGYVTDGDVDEAAAEAAESDDDNE